jgi:hypothetical protein
MCPGGKLHGSQTQPEAATNGWSPSKVLTEYRHPGIVVELKLEDFQFCRKKH